MRGGELAGPWDVICLVGADVRDSCGGMPEPLVIGDRKSVRRYSGREKRCGGKERR